MSDAEEETDDPDDSGETEEEDDLGGSAEDDVSSLPEGGGDHAIGSSGPALVEGEVEKDYVPRKRPKSLTEKSIDRAMSIDRQNSEQNRVRVSGGRVTREEFKRDAAPVTVEIFGQTFEVDPRLDEARWKFKGRITLRVGRKITKCHIKVVIEPDLRK